MILRFLAFLLFSFSFLKAHSQDETERTECCCSLFINQLSAGWKADSLANTNFRFNNYKKLVSCKIDTVSVAFLLEKFGPPVYIKQTEEGWRYLYLYYDDKTNGSKRPASAGGIYFDFNPDKKRLVRTGSFVLDY
jgi:hypothetical protein